MSEITEYLVPTVSALRPLVAAFQPNAQDGERAEFLWVVAQVQQTKGGETVLVFVERLKKLSATQVGRLPIGNGKAFERGDVNALKTRMSAWLTAQVGPDWRTLDKASFVERVVVRTAERPSDPKAEKARKALADEVRDLKGNAEWVAWADSLIDDGMADGASAQAIARLIAARVAARKS